MAELYSQVTGHTGGGMPKEQTWLKLICEIGPKIRIAELTSDA